MPRLARIVVPDIPHHVTQRGSNRQDIFFSDEDLYRSGVRERVKTWRKRKLDDCPYFLSLSGGTSATRQKFRYSS
jgi:REP element-mobilizing transposase RayT